MGNNSHVGLRFLSCCRAKIPWQNQLQEERFCVAKNSRLQSIMWKSQGSWNLKKLVIMTCRVKNREQWTDTYMPVPSSFLFFFFSPEPSP